MIVIAVISMIIALTCFLLTISATVNSGVKRETSAFRVGIILSVATFIWLTTAMLLVIMCKTYV